MSQVDERAVGLETLHKGRVHIERPDFGHYRLKPLVPGIYLLIIDRVGKQLIFGVLLFIYQNINSGHLSC